MIICADDFGLAGDINKATLDLLERGRVTAVSVMAGLENLGREDIAPLLEFSGKADIGLHLTLTDEGIPSSQFPGSIAPGGRFMSFGKLALRCYAGQVNPDDAKGDISAQYDLFISKAGRAPDFIDGHLHVQQLPGVREGLCDFIGTLPANQRPYVRNAYTPLTFAGGLHGWKRNILSIPGRGLRNMLAHKDICTNSGFEGVYNYNRFGDYPKLIESFFARLRDPNGILMIHPGLDERWRKMEYETLRGADLGHVRVNRFMRP
ncbi:MAG: ChbG/HpnK family deacetylase [Nitrospinae bacterium]|nr:ChbG/HpnK family deacetylase [Nitrospinota bacterium]